MPILNVSENDFSRIIRALNTDGNMCHNCADEEHEAGNFWLRDSYRDRGNSYHKLARDLRTQKSGN